MGKPTGGPGRKLSPYRHSIIISYHSIVCSVCLCVGDRTVVRGWGRAGVDTPRFTSNLKWNDHQTSDHGVRSLRFHETSRGTRMGSRGSPGARRSPGRARYLGHPARGGPRAVRSHGQRARPGSGHPTDLSRSHHRLESGHRPSGGPRRRTGPRPGTEQPDGAPRGAHGRCRGRARRFVAKNLGISSPRPSPAVAVGVFSLVGARLGDPVAPGRAPAPRATRGHCFDP